MNSSAKISEKEILHNSVSKPEYDLAGQIIGLAMKVHRILGPGFLESVYQKALLYELVKAGFKVESIAEVDFKRIFQIMRQYSSASFDFTDVAILAIAERLNISQIYTFDRRDFLIYKPIHTEYLELLP